jgi:hypothetical protein
MNVREFPRDLFKRSNMKPETITRSSLSSPFEEVKPHDESLARQNFKHEL